MTEGRQTIDGLDRCERIEYEILTSWLAADGKG